MDFGADQFGIHDTTPTDLMRTFLEGVIEHVVHLVADPMAPMDKASLDCWINHVFGNEGVKALVIWEAKKYSTDSEAYVFLTKLFDFSAGSKQYWLHIRVFEPKQKRH